MRLAVLVVAVALIVIPDAGAAGGRWNVYARPEVGLSVRFPAGWHVIGRRLAPCLNPVQRLALAGHGALVVVDESLDPRHYMRRLPARPARFRLEGRPSFLSCCEPLDRRGWFLSFRDAGRGFYAYVYTGRPGTRAEVLGVLNSLRVRQAAKRRAASAAGGRRDAAGPRGRSPSVSAVARR